MIAGFPTETEKDHTDTLSLMDYVKYDFGFMFTYSERPGTLLQKNLKIISEINKKNRTQEILIFTKSQSLSEQQYSMKAVVSN